MTEEARPTWSIITVSYNSAQTLRSYFTTPVSPKIERIVVDNCSADDSVEVAGRAGAHVVRLDRNMGFAAANNVGLATATGRYIMFANPDVRVRFDDLTAIEDYIESLGPALVAPQLINEDGSLQPNGRGEPYLARKIGNRLVRRENPQYLLYAHDGRVRKVSWLTGAVIAADRTVWEKLGGWDESYFLYHEDTELSMNAENLGIDRHVLGDIRWTHGWDRAASGTNWAAWKRELTAARTFYRRHVKYLGIPRKIQ